MSEDKPTVIYHPIPDHPGYRVGSDGTVWTAWKRVSLGRYGSKYVLSEGWQQLTPKPDQSGYVLVMLSPSRRRFLVHRLVLEAFVGPCPDNMEACHSSDPTRTNNSLANLRWDTKKANQADRIEHGTDLRGEDNPFAKLTEATVRAIRSDCAAGMSYRQAATKHGTSYAQVGHIVRRVTWAHVV